MKKILLLLILFILIVSPVISQTRYIIGNDTLVVYNDWEQRKIAHIFLERDVYKSLSDNAIRTICTQQSIISSLKYNISISDSTIMNQYNMLSMLQHDNYNLQSSVNKYREQLKTTNIILTSVCASAVIITLALILIPK